MATNIDFIDLVRQKRELIKKLKNLDAEQFGATSIGQMQRITSERGDYYAALKKVNSLLDLDQYDGLNR